jgi:hypothetical protein
MAVGGPPAVQGKGFGLHFLLVRRTAPRAAFFPVAVGGNRSLLLAADLLNPHVIDEH